MTDPTPTPGSATPLWRPQSVVPSEPAQPVEPALIAPGPVTTGPPRAPFQGPQPTWTKPPAAPTQVWGPLPSAGPQPVPYLIQLPAPMVASPLPVEEKRYSQFLQTPRRRWWKLPIALVVAGVVWFLGTLIVSVPALVYDLATRGISVTDVARVTDYLTSIGTSVTPAIFLANNVGIALMIPSAWLGLIIYGQKPRWLSSVTGGLRWGWLFRLMGLMLVPYLLMTGFDALGGAFSGLSWRPYSWFMILVVLLTTPLQCAGEEYGTRGLINRLFGSYGSSRVSFWIGALVSSGVFMWLHAAADVYLNAFYFTFGMVASWMAWRTGGLEASIAMHVVNNVLAMSVLPFSDFSKIFDRGAGTASALAMVPLAIVMLACVGIVEWQVRRRKPVAVAAPGRTVEPPAYGAMAPYPYAPVPSQ